MATQYLDTSAAAKRYVVETGTAWVTALTDPAAGNECLVSTLTRVELVAALYQNMRTGRITLTQARRAELLLLNELATHFHVIPVQDVIINQAMRLVAAYPLRAYDAVQLATALEAQARRKSVGGLAVLTFVSADLALNRIAAAEGLAADDPNAHP